MFMASESKDGAPKDEEKGKISDEIQITLGSRIVEVTASKSHQIRIRLTLNWVPEDERKRKAWESGKSLGRERK